MDYSNEQRVYLAEASKKLVEVLERGRTYNIFSSLLTASVVITSMITPKATGDGGGFTVFAPIDQAFLDTSHFKSLPAPSKTRVVGLHVIPTYLPLGKFKSFVTPAQPTLSTTWFGNEGYKLNVTKTVGSSITIKSSLVTAEVTQILNQDKGMAVFGVSKLLLPKEVFDRKGEL